MYHFEQKYRMTQEAEISDEAVEFTLEDAYENLKDVREDLRQELDDWIHRDVNNELGTLAMSARQDEMIIRYQKLLAGLSMNLSSQEPFDLPLANTIDLQKTLVHDFEDVADQMQQVINSIRTDMAATKKNIAYIFHMLDFFAFLAHQEVFEMFSATHVCADCIVPTSSNRLRHSSLESNMEGLAKMKTACIGAIENVGIKTTYDKEISVTSRLFKECKDDLYSVVETIFPGNYPFKDLLANLVQAYAKGGDDVYIDVVPEALNFAKFLIEADIAIYHRNDKNKIKMMDVL